MKQRKQGIRASVSSDRHIQEVEAVVQENDSPMPAATELALLHKVRPDLVDSCMKEHHDEAEYQRTRFTRIDRFVFLERLLGLLAAVVLTLVAFWVSYLLAIAGHDWPSCVISGGTIVGIVAAILNRNRSSK